MKLSLRLLNQQLFPLWLPALLLIVPFNLASRFPPYKSFYQDAIVILLILMLFLTLLAKRQILIALPRGVVYFFILAFYWCLQPLLVELPYPEQNIRVGLLFILLGLLVWSIQGLLLQYGREVVVTWVAWAVLLGVGFQSLVLLLQFSGMADWVKWFVFSDGTNVSGQFGQRNMLGHYMMWGMLAAAYLIGKQRIPIGWGAILVLLLGSCLALVSSRTIIAYVLAILLLLFLLRVFLGRSNDRVIKILFFTVCWVLLAQWLAPYVLNTLGIEAQSGLERLVERPDAQFRTPEWGKAWQIFLSSPLVGHGWHSYPYQSIIADWEFIPESQFHLNGTILHSHNIILQVLAEMGFVGAILAFGGLVWVVIPMFKQLKQSHYVWLFTLLSVTACHSLLEFPLWYSYFLTAAVIFLALGQPIKSLAAYPKVRGISWSLLVATSVSGLLMVLFVLGFNQWLIQKNIQAFFHSADLRTIRIKAMVELGQVTPMLSPYGDIGDLQKINIARDDLSPENILLIERYNQYFPIYPAANLQGLSLYRQGKHSESIDWMKKVWHYYPRQIPQFMTQIYEASPVFKGLEIPIYEACLRQKELALYEIFKKAKGCPKPPSLKEVKNQTE